MQWLRDLPPISRGYFLVSVTVTLLCALDVIEPLDVIFNFYAIWNRGQWWRLFTNFFFFGTFDFYFVLHMFFLVRHLRWLEEQSFRGKTADFLYMLVLGGVALTVVAPFTSVMVLGPSMSFMVVYVWSRLHPMLPMELFGVVRFRSVWLPFALVMLSVIFGNFASVVYDLLGLVAGHLYFYFREIFPRPVGLPPRPNLVATPRLIVWLVDVVGDKLRLLPFVRPPAPAPAPDVE